MMKTETPAPIVLFVYNRPLHTMQAVEALQKNILAENSELFIYSDAPSNDLSLKSVEEVRSYIRQIGGFRKVTIIEREKNYGLATNIIDGVTSIVNNYGNIIVLEDDLVTSPFFLKFMNDALCMYENDIKVACIHSYIYPINGLPETFFIKGADCWGWATWKRAWDIFETNGQKLLNEIEKKGLQKEIDFNNSYGYVQMLKDQISGKNNSWAVRWYISSFLRDMLCLYPGRSFVQNIGFDSAGTHTKSFSDVFRVTLSDNYNFSKISLKEDKSSKKKIEYFFKSKKNTFYRRLKSKIKQIL